MKLPYYFPTKDPGESKTYGLEFDILLADSGDTINTGYTPTASVTNSNNGDSIACTNTQWQGTTLVTTISGGTIGTTYQIAFTYALTNAGRQVDTILLPVDVK